MCIRDSVTPLVLAAALGHTQIVRDLLDHNADVSTTTTHEMTALMAAASEGNDDVVKVTLTFYKSTVIIYVLKQN